MAEIKIEMPERLMEHVQRWVSTGRYADAGDYLRDLVRRDESAEERLIEALESGLASGISSRSFEEIWASGVEKAQSRAA